MGLTPENKLQCLRYLLRYTLIIEDIIKNDYERLQKCIYIKDGEYVEDKLLVDMFKPESVEWVNAIKKITFKHIRVVAAMVKAMWRGEEYVEMSRPCGDKYFGYVPLDRDEEQKEADLKFSIDFFDVWRGLYDGLTLSNDPKMIFYKADIEGNDKVVYCYENMLLSSEELNVMIDIIK